MFVSRSYEFDAAHRVMRDGGKCKHLHGHRYKVVAVVEAAVNEDPNSPAAGMVMNFSVLKEKIEKICEPMDHATLLEYRDPILTKLFGGYNFNVQLPKVLTEDESVKRSTYPPSYPGDEADGWWKTYAEQKMAPFGHGDFESLFEDDPADHNRQHRVVVFVTSPTAETLAKYIGDSLLEDLGDYAVRSLAVRVYETPNCYAEHRVSNYLAFSQDELASILAPLPAGTLVGRTMLDMRPLPEFDPVAEAAKLAADDKVGKEFDQAIGYERDTMEDTF